MPRVLQTSLICGTTIIKLYSAVLATRVTQWKVFLIMFPDQIPMTLSTEVQNILATMSNNKAGDSYGLCTEHYKLAGDLYCSLLAVCFNVMFVHGYVPVEATQTVICPTVKDKNGDLSDISNYALLLWQLSFQKFWNMLS